MGILSAMADLRKLEAPREGTLTVLSISAADPSATAERYTLNGVVQAVGVDATAITHRGTGPVAKWPKPGSALPVRILRRWPLRILVLWDEVPENVLPEREQ